jgi:hypothetical protein
MSSNMDTLKLKGSLKISLTDNFGNLKYETILNNLVVNSGLEFIARRMIGSSWGVMSHMGVGSGTAEATASDTDITIIGTRQEITVTNPTYNTVRYVSIFPPGSSTGTITEAGIFNASSAGNMLCKRTFSPINKASSDSMTITWTITLSA